MKFIISACEFKPVRRSEYLKVIPADQRRSLKARSSEAKTPTGFTKNLLRHSRPISNSDSICRLNREGKMEPAPGRKRELLTLYEASSRERLANKHRNDSAAYHCQATKINAGEASIDPYEPALLEDPRLGSINQESEQNFFLSSVALTSSITPQYSIWQTPRLQLGNAPLIGYDGSSTDQIELLWQTRPAGSGTQDRFTVDVRLTDSSAWSPGGTIEQLPQVDGRIVFSTRLGNLQYATDYEYRVRHWSGDVLQAEYSSPFRTRLAAGSSTAFSFVAYGDSADVYSINQFRSVQARINSLDQVSPLAFAMLLGDNAYDVGSQDQLDYRFVPSLAPEATAWNARHIDYAAFGNHDTYTDDGAPSEASFSSPRPVAGLTSIASPPSGERPEHNYSFDYGNVHIATFDSNSLYDPARLDAQLKWLETDMAASSATWKLVAAHQPLAGSPDKPESPIDNYYQQVVSRLRAAKVDVLLSGHTHTYHQSYPLLGANNGAATYVLDTDGVYNKGAGLVQVAIGTGGTALRDGSFSGSPFIRAGFSTTTNPAVEPGFGRIDVSGDTLKVSYVAADDGAALSSFTIQIQESKPPVITDIIVRNDRVYLLFNEPIASSIPASKILQVKVGGLSSPISSRSIDTTRNRLVLNLSETPTSDQSVLVTYSDPSGDQSGDVVEDVAGNDLQSLSRYAKTYQSATTVTTLNDKYKTLILMGSVNLNGVGNAHSNVIRGNSGANILRGGGGNDTITGGLGNDMIFGGTGRDRLTGNDGDDRFEYGRASYALIGGSEFQPLFERIADLQIGQASGSDTINAMVTVPTSARVLDSQPNALTRSEITTLLNDSSGSIANFSANGASCFSFGSGGSLRTFLAINDGTAGFDYTLDQILEISGYNGNLASLMVI